MVSGLGTCIVCGGKLSNVKFLYYNACCYFFVSVFASVYSWLLDQAGIFVMCPVCRLTAKPCGNTRHVYIRVALPVNACLLMLLYYNLLLISKTDRSIDRQIDILIYLPINLKVHVTKKSGYDMHCHYIR